MAVDMTSQVELTSSEESRSRPVDDNTQEQEFLTPVRCFALSKYRKSLVLLNLSIIVFFDSFATYTAPMPLIQMDMDIPLPQQSWIISSYLITFASFNIFFGRVSDMYSPAWVLLCGLVAYSIINIVISFIPSNMYAFFVLRALCGIAGAAITPSSYRIITNTFQASERPRAFSVYATAGALASTFGGTLSGAIVLIPGGGQMIGWRWFFRVAAVGVLIPTILCAMLIPKTCGPFSHVTEKAKSLDIFGALVLLAATVLTIVGLTSGAAAGFSSANFLATFIIGVLLFPAFLYWEYTRPPYQALIPSKMWRIPNFWVLLVYGVPLMSWWVASATVYMQVYTKVYNEKPWHAAVRLLASGIASLVAAPVLQQFPGLLRLPTLRWTITAGALPAIVGYVLFAQPDDYAKDYWRIIVPGLVLGSAGNTAAFVGTQVALMSAAPPSLAGITGAMLQVASALGSAVALGAQSGFMSSRPGDVFNKSNLHDSFYFQVGWQALWLVAFLIVGRPKKTIRWDADA